MESNLSKRFPPPEIMPCGWHAEITQFDHNAKTERVKSGAGSMPAFKNVLNEQEINAVVAYVETLKK